MGLIIYLACNAHAPYCHLWSVPALEKLSRLSHKRHVIRKNDIEHEICALVSSTTFVETLPIRRRDERDMAKYVFWSSRKAHVALVLL